MAYEMAEIVRGVSFVRISVAFGREKDVYSTNVLWRKTFLRDLFMYSFRAVLFVMYLNGDDLEGLLQVGLGVRIFPRRDFHVFVLDLGEKANNRVLQLVHRIGSCNQVINFCGGCRGLVESCSEFFSGV